MTDDELTVALAEVLAGAGVGVWPGPATSDQVGIFYGTIGTKPDRAVGIVVYGTEDDPSPRTPTAVRRVQLRYRGARHDPRGADVLSGRVLPVLNRAHQPAPGISRSRRISSAQLGTDENGRQERTDNYEIILTPAPGGSS